ncbi:hypothetical protein [Schaalia dentiphila]|uniref:hypothetical protein n=1 Tax=Schaalia dentiphila TaxID=3050224 RepID=UPI00285277AB|nr:hypothetical protein [Schaalia sp. C24]
MMTGYNASSSERDVRVFDLEQQTIINGFFANGDGPWTVVYDEWSVEGVCNGGQFIALSQPTLRDKILADVGWDVRKGEGIPGFVMSGDEVSYYKSASLPEFEPLVILQEFFGIVPDVVNISEDFRYLMRLWLDNKSGNYYQIREDGDKELAVRVSGDRIEVRTPLLKRYLAARQLDAVMYIDSNVSACFDGELSDLSDLDSDVISAEHLTCLSRNVWRDSSQRSRVWTRLLAKRILEHPSREKCGIWPWDDIESDEYPEFIIGENDSGEAVSWTCSPEHLRNYYGKNPDAPHYLTPVYFKPEVLKRYYEDDGCEVRDGYLSCGNQWGVSIDNGCLSYVSVFLGDIGRDIPQSHWNHWKAYNIAPIGGMSEEAIRRSFFNQSVKSRNPEHIFKRVYAALQEEWEKGWGWRLHRKAEGLDAGVLARLHIPVNESEAEFRAQSLNLALVLVDLLNEKRLIQGMDKVDNEKGIDRLSRFLESNRYEYVERDISLLRKVQQMRSRFAAHSSGTKGRVCLEEELGDRSHREYFIDVINQTTQMLLDLKRFAMSRASARDS